MCTVVSYREKGYEGRREGYTRTLEGGKMTNNPNAEWENCDYLLWPAWYAWLSWGLLAAIFIFAGYCTIMEV